MNERFYHKILMIRRIEEAVEKIYSLNLIGGTTHLSIGEEAVAAGVIEALNEGDIVTSNHRGHGHFFSYTNDAHGFIAEILGLSCGVCGGRGGSQHLCKGDFYSNGVTGGMPPIGVGMAYAEKLKRSGRIVASFFGDGALCQGIMHEAFNIASILKAPILFVLEDNKYAMSTCSTEHTAGSIRERIESYGIRYRKADGMDVADVYKDSQELVDALRRDPAPAFLHCDTYRLRGHSKSDKCCYRSKDEERSWEAKDPLKKLSEDIAPGKRVEIEGSVEAEIRQVLMRLFKEKPEVIDKLCLCEKVRSKV